MLKILTYIYSALFWAYVLLFFALVPLFALPFSLIFGLKRSFRFFFKIYIRSGMAIFGFTTTVSGLENMPGGKNVILVSNHPTFFDPILLNNALPGFYNFIVFATMLYTPLTIFAIRFLGLIIRLYGNFLSGSKAIINAAKAINEGDSFILFPTEFIVPEGNIDKIRPGVYKIFEATSAVILPVYIKSGIKFTFLLKPFRSNVIIGKPLDRQHILYGRDNAIKQAVESLRPEVQ